MKKNSTPAADLLETAQYIRMSSSKQETSPKQQRDDIAKHAPQFGLRVVTEYADEAKKGSDAKRPGFLRLIADAEAGKFKAIVVWDLDRFSRFDPMEFNAYLLRLRKAGVRLFSVTNGGEVPLNTDDLGDWLKINVDQHANHSFLVKLSRRVTLAINGQSERGEWHAKAPYGLDRCFYDAQGKFIQRVKSGHKKPVKTWVCKLMPGDVAAEGEDASKLDDGGAAANVRWLFETYAKNDVSLMWLLKEIRKRTGRRVALHNLVVMMENLAYVGHSKSGDRSGKHENRIGKFNQLERITVHNTHPAIVDQSTFDRVQEKLATRKMGRRVRSPKEGQGGFLLSGFLRCGCCGGRMAGKNVAKRKQIHGAKAGAKSMKVKGSHRYYLCSNAAWRHTNCHLRVVKAEILESAVLDFIQEHVLEEDNLARVREAIAKSAKAKHGRSGDPHASARKEIDKLNKQIDRAVEHVAAAEDRETAAGIQKLITKWRERREELRATLTLTTAPTGDVDATVARAEEFARNLRKGLQHASMAARREALGQLLRAFTVYWHPGKTWDRTGRKRWKLARGVLEFSHNTPNPSPAPAGSAIRRLRSPRLRSLATSPPR